MPTVSNQNIALVHRKEWQMMTPAPAASAAGSFVIVDSKEEDNIALYVVSATVHYLYHHDEDAWVQIPSGALAGTFGAGACGTRSRFSTTITANGGSTTTATTATAITGLCKNKTIRFLSGANIGREATITGVIINPGGTNTIQFAALPSAVANTDTFAIDTGRFFVVNGGTQASGSFKNYDPLTGVWTTLSITGMPATLGTDAKMVVTPSDRIIVTGTATAGGASTLTNSAKTWTVNQWCNSQVRITAGTGIGQVRTIASNTATVLTTSVAWTTTPDATSQYELTGNDDFIYLLGNNAVTMYRYSISGNTWTIIAPTTARPAAPGVGMSANWAGNTGDTNWANESDIRNGRYIYSFRGGVSAAVDRFDIAGGTAGAGAWLNINYNGIAESFTTGSSYGLNNGYIFIKKDATNRFFKFSIPNNYMEPLSTNLYTDGAALLGDKLWVKDYVESGVVKLSWVYSLRNTGTELHRLLLI